MSASKLQKLSAVAIVAVLSTGFSFLGQFLTGLMRDDIIEGKNLGDILTQIEEAGVDKRTLANVLRESPPVVPIFITSIVGIAITVWLYHKVLGYLYKSKRNPNQSSDPT